jgi:hypothetical protein
VIPSFGVIGLYFFKHNNEVMAMATSAFYVHMIQTFFLQELTQFLQISENTWFQQDGTSLCMARSSINAINQLPNHVVSRHCNFSWPVRLHELLACDFLLGVLKDSLSKSIA